MDFPGTSRRIPAWKRWVSQYTHHHLAVFLLTFFSYALLHASRKSFSNVKVSISSQWTPSNFNSSEGLFPNEEMYSFYRTETTLGSNHNLEH
ncbi:sugar phosphate exchanger 3 [Pelobates cultripes]|uniref:Sugar phosphate exchanger 3 n=1 Tax=Pelobates cultripes TaxID=61616 RepID=A0AAD1TTK3_PELCU|nr:sugar phosphate exchanger 3 [Pelobates cultripes]